MNKGRQAPVKKSRLKRFLTWIANVQINHPFSNLLLVRLSAIWFSLILTYFGESLSLIYIDPVTNKRGFSLFGIIATVFIILATTLGELAKLYYEQSDNEPFEVGGFIFLNNLRNAFNITCKNKYSTLLSKIHALKSTQSNDIPAIISDPPKQLNIIADEMQNCLRHLLREDNNKHWAKDDDLFVSIIYQFPEEGTNAKWYWATEEHGLGIEGLLKDYEGGKTSTFKYLIANKGSVRFFNSKADAEKNCMYIEDDLDERDDNGNLMGSIACYEDFIKKGDIEYIHYVLMISTYSKKFTSSLSKEAVDNVKHNMKEFIISDFQFRIRIELCLLYLSELQKHPATIESMQDVQCDFNTLTTFATG